MAEQTSQERVAAAVAERFRERVEHIKEVLMTHSGRPGFMVQLSGAQRQAMFENPMLRAKAITGLTARQGIAAAYDYFQRMGGQGSF